MDNRCVCCGEIIPEGRQVCPNCEKGKRRITMKNRNKVIQGLKVCIQNDDLTCKGNCPYCGEDSCVDKVMADALELLEG